MLESVLYFIFFEGCFLFVRSGVNLKLFLEFGGYIGLRKFRVRIKVVIEVYTIV